MREKLKKMKYAEVKKMVLTDAEYIKYFDAWEHLVADFHDLPGIFPGIGDGGKRTDAVQASLFDAIHAEILGEKISRREKFLRTHMVRNDGKPVRKDKRKSYRKELTYSCDPWIGWGVVKHRREQIKLESRMADFDAELAEHESRMAEYYDLMTCATGSRDMAESMLDERLFVTPGLTPEILIHHKTMYEKDAETMTESALNILKGECY